MDFNKLLAESGGSDPVEPRELYGSLPNKEAGYGYLRDVQGQVLGAWHDRRMERDLVVKVNTGGGKTIDGLVILQSYLNAGEGPALYVASNKYLVEQVRTEARRLGIATVDDPDDRRYLAGEAIAVVTADKLLNGRSVFSHKRTPKTPVPVGSVVIDDAHAALAITRTDLSLELPREHPVFGALLSLFEEDLRQQAPNDFLDVQDRSPSALARLPFWSWRSKVEQVRGLLHEHRDSDALKFRWPAVQEVLHLCRVVFTDKAVSITPPCPPIRHVTGFAEAAHRVYLTATLADDGVLVTDFGATADSVRTPIAPVSAGDIGERMILAPQEINPGLDPEEIRAAIAGLADKHNVVVVVPSIRAASVWQELGAEVAVGTQVEEAVARLRAGHVGLVVLVNRYDGIDLPDDACRVLVLDRLPEAFTGEERVQSQLVSRSAGIDDRQVQRIEQGMGRGVRSNEDHCVVFLLGSRLSQLVATPSSLARFGAATRAQLELSRQVASNLDDQPLAAIMAVAQQALTRDPGWVKLARLKLASLPASAASVSDVAIARRRAFESAADADYPAAADHLSAAVAAAGSDREKGALLEEQAAYLDQRDPECAQLVLAAARAKNNMVLRPLSGLEAYKRLPASYNQAQRAAHTLTELYPTSAALRLGFQTVAEELSFDPDRTDEAEEALRRVGEHLGLAAERPEHETGAGPDDLWGLGGSVYWVIEAKTGRTGNEIYKSDANQLSGSVHWFRGKYPADARAVPVMVHRARLLARDAAVTPGTKILDEDGANRLKAALQAFAAALAVNAWDNPDVVARMLMGHKLRSSDLDQYLKNVRRP